MARTRRIKNKRKLRTNGTKRKSRPNYNTKRINKRRTKRRINKKNGGAFHPSTTQRSGFTKTSTASTAYRQARDTKLDRKAADLSRRRAAYKSTNPSLMETMRQLPEALDLVDNAATKFEKEKIKRAKAAEKAVQGKRSSRKTRSCCSSKPRRS